MRGSIREPRTEATVRLGIATCTVGRREPCPSDPVWVLGAAHNRDWSSARVLSPITPRVLANAPLATGAPSAPPARCLKLTGGTTRGIIPLLHRRR